MRQAMRLPIYVATLLTVVSAIDIPVFTNFVTTEVATISHSSTVKLIGYLCGQARGNHVNVSLELPHNPDWNPSLGVLYYYVVDSPSKGEADALCTNLHQGVPGPSCNVKSWPSVGDLYITVHSGLADAVAFSVIGTSYTKREVNPGVGGERTRKVFSPLKPPTANRVPRLPPGQETKEGQVIYLAEFVTLMGPQAIPRLQKAHLNFTFCPTPRMGRGTSSRPGSLVWT
ncbi:uncharacterized protein LOC110985026 [Acanthaster planci]|uniref:Uncharacterized protein LOC110985026 n=1 Tax=Acanthaster planci TaxID=133434 RepID=A0A8B7Z8Y0_ACAPL|nr:uncharacterized protein LOC110985026 [Acanthaster planci]